ncbi:hypothetical protein [Bacillus sp. AK031]
MEKEILRMLEECKLRYHLRSLMPEKPFVVAFDNGEDLKLITLGRNVEPGLVNKENPEIDFLIEGTPDVIADLLNGRERLSLVSSREEVTVKGTYRGLLFVESVLTLCRKYEVEPVVV